MPPIVAIRKLHMDTMDELDVDAATRTDVNKLMDKMEQVCTGVALMQELTSRTRATLVSFGEAVQVDPIKPTLTAPGTKRLKL